MLVVSCCSILKWCLMRTLIVFFESVVGSALDYRALRHVVWHLCERGEFGKYNADFRAVLDRLGGRPLAAG